MGLRSARQKIFAEHDRKSTSSADFHFQSGKGLVRAHTESGAWRSHRKAEARPTEMGFDTSSGVRFVATAETESADDGGRGSDNGFAAGRTGSFAVGAFE